MEIMYLAEKQRISILLSETLSAIRASPLHLVADLTLEILVTAETVEILRAS